MKRRQLRSRRSRRSNVPAALGLILLAAVALVVVGILRYGSPENLVRRVNTEITARRPRTHSLLVPTPLAPMTTPAAPIAPHADLDGGNAEALADKAPTADPSASTGAMPTPAPDTPPPSVQLTGLTHMWQTWNNCGPATLAMNMSYYGLVVSQADVGAILRPYIDDKNVGPEELADFARTHGLHAVVRVNGDMGRLRQLLDDGIPVLIETWHEPEPDDGMGHYRLLTGYNDASQEWIAYDSFDSTGVDPKRPYAGIRVPYAQLDRLWRVFNSLYIIIYPDMSAPTVQRILGQDMDEAAMWRRALGEAQAATETQPGDAYAWFNLGTDLVALGDFDQAAAAYDRARQIGLPWRMLWYQFGPFQTYYQVGRFDEVIALADATLLTTDDIEEVYYWRGLALAAQGMSAEARDAWERALALNPNFAAPAAALADLSS